MQTTINIHIDTKRSTHCNGYEFKYRLMHFIGMYVEKRALLRIVEARGHPVQSPPAPFSHRIFFQSNFELDLGR